MKNNFLIRIGLILGLIFSTLTIGIFNNKSLNTKIINQQIKSDPENKFPDALPYDFFGDYSHPEFWYKPSTGEVVYEDPNSAAYLQKDAYTGQGIKTFTEYTSQYNKEVKKGYEGHYNNNYHDFIINPDNINGFIGLDPNWTLLDVSYYLEDWIVWNSNEIQNYDDLYNDGNKILNSDIYLQLDGKSIVDDVEEFYGKFIRDFDEWYVMLSSIDRPRTIYFFKEQPISDEGIYEGIPEAWEYEIYELSRLIFPEEKASAVDKFDYTDIHNEFSTNFDLNSEFDDFKEKANEEIYLDLNKDFLNDSNTDYPHGVEDIEHDINQGYYEIETIKYSDYNVVYYELVESNGNTGWIIINNENRTLESFEMIKLKIVVDDSITTSSSGWHTKFNPSRELYVPPTPFVPEEKGIPSIFIIIFITIGIASAIIVTGGIIYLVTRNRNKSNNEK